MLSFINGLNTLAQRQDRIGLREQRGWRMRMRTHELIERTTLSQARLNSLPGVGTPFRASEFRERQPTRVVHNKLERLESEPCCAL